MEPPKNTIPFILTFNILEVKLAYLTSWGLRNSLRKKKKGQNFSFKSEKKHLLFYTNKQIFILRQPELVKWWTSWTWHAGCLTWLRCLDVGDVEFCLLSAQRLICSGFWGFKYLKAKSKVKVLHLTFTVIPQTGHCQGKVQSQSLPPCKNHDHR